MTRALEPILVVPDTHHPFQDERAIQLMLKVAKQLRPKHVIHLGDLVDFYALSFHSKDPKRATELDEELASGKEFLCSLKAVGANNNVLLGSNHHDRLVRYMQQKAPELHDILTERKLLDLDKIGFKLIPYRQSYKLGSIRYTHDIGLAGQQAALKSSAAIGHSTIIGHVHRIEFGVSGTTEGETRIAASFGWLGDRNAIDYMHKDKVAKDWALGFGVGYLRPDNGYTYFVPVCILPDYTCVFNGQLFQG